MVETYLNTFDMRSGAFTGFQHRSGTGLYWGNTFITDPGFVRGYELKAMRQQSPFDPWSGANGKNPLDSNDTEGNFTYVAGHTPHLYYSGTVVTSGNNVVIVSGTPWTVNQWLGYEVTNNITGVSSLIQSNTSNTLTLADQILNNPAVYTAGDTFVIYHLARASLDQPGMGKGDLVTGNPPTNTRWPNEQVEPVYAWMNTQTINSVTTNFTAFLTNSIAATLPTLIANRDYYNWNAAWTPGSQVSTGVAVGTFAQMMATTGAAGQDGASFPGTGFWTTDHSEFYVWQNGTWMLYYAPYAYPHPLAAGGPEAPSNLRILP